MSLWGGAKARTGSRPKAGVLEGEPKLAQHVFAGLFYFNPEAPNVPKGLTKT